MKSDHSEVVRKHVTIMFTDIAGYTALMGSDEDRAFKILRRNRAIHQDLAKKYDGKLIKELGDGMLLSFNLPSDAVRCAIEIQTTCKAEQIPLKVGIHDGEVTFEGMDVFGDGVNISSRLQADARKGNIYVSDSVYRNVKNKKDIRSRFIDEKSYKNVDEVIKVYQIITSEDELLEKPTRAQKTWRKNLNYALAAVLGLAIVVILIWKFYPSNIGDQERSIAVMPFSNETADSSNIYLANGMMEEIRNSLAKIGDLRVLSKTSTQKYRATTLSLFDIADELNVNYLVEGSIQRQGDILKINTQLIDIKNDDNIWAETYRSGINNVFSVQSEVAQAIAGQLKAIISPEEMKVIEAKPTNNDEAYDLYLRGKEFFNRGGKSNLNMAINFYERAIDLDSEFALAYAWLGMAYFQQSFWDDYFKENFGDTMKYFANKALSLSPDLSDGYWLLAEYYWQTAEYDSCIVYAKNASDLNPNNGYAYEIMGKGYYFNRDYPNALINFEKCRRILIGDNVQYPRILDWFSTVYMAIGDYEEAHKYREEIVNYNPNDGYWGLWLLNLMKMEFDLSKIYLDSLCALDSVGWCRFSLMYYYIFSGQLEKLKPENDHLDLFSITEPHWKAYILTKLNRHEDAKEYYDQSFEYLQKTIELERITGKGGINPYDLAAQFAWIGNKEKAYEILYYMEKEQNLEGWMVWWMDYDPRFEAIREEDAFKEIIQRQEERYSEIRAEIETMETAGVF